MRVCWDMTSHTHVPYALTAGASGAAIVESIAKIEDEVGGDGGVLKVAEDESVLPPAVSSDAATSADAGLEVTALVAGLAEKKLKRLLWLAWLLA